MIQILPFLNNSKDLDPSYKMDLGFWACFGRKKKLLSYNQRNIVQSRFENTLKCLSIGTPKTINFPFVPNEKLMDFRCPSIEADHK